MSDIETVARTRVFGGEQIRLAHHSDCCNSRMTFSIYMPPADHPVPVPVPVPVLYWLSGLTCSDENFLIKAGAQRVAAELGLALVAPDTSPRDIGLPGEDDSYDLGSGAGFYVNATEAPWRDNYNMYDYVTAELPEVVTKNFALNDRASIAGHSMGGHGALVAGLRNPDRYRSVSAFAPIGNPAECPWGQKAFAAYLGNDRDSWLEYDTCHLMKIASGSPPLFVDQGSDDEFLEEQLLTPRLVEAARLYNRPLELRMQPGYDHSYYFIASFIEDHLRFHSDALAA